MLNSRLVRKDPYAIASALAKRNVLFPVEDVLRWELERKEAQIAVDTLRHKRKDLAKRIGAAKRQGTNVGVPDLLIESEALDQVLVRQEATLTQVSLALDNLLLATPNIPHESVPEGKGENDNLELYRWGIPRVFDFAVKDHVTLGAKLGLDFEAGVKLAGSRFTVMTGIAAKLHRALIQLMLDMHSMEHGYVEVNVPYLVNEASMRGTGQLPKFAEDLFVVDRNNAGATLYLIPTAEVPVTNLARDVIFDSSDLEKKWVCHTPCFRSEAGSAGKDTAGLIRQHQFEKVELVKIVKPEDSYAALESLTLDAEAILKKLNLPYRKVVLCTGDLGFSAAKTYDLEVWLPGQGKYREISSCSNFEDFQARRLQARYRPSKGEAPQLVHTVNGSGLAVGRTLVALIENYQQEDGSLTIPDALKPYMPRID